MRYTVITDINKIDRRDWDLFIQEHPNGTVFQSSETYFLFKNAQNFEPVPVLVSDDKGIKGVLLAVIIKEYSSKIGFFTSRTVIYGGPLIDPSIKDISRVLDLLLKELIKKVKNKSIFIQFRNFFEWSEEYKDVFTQNGFQYLERLNFLVDTSTEQLVKKRMSKSKLRQIRKSLEAGAEIIEPENIEQVREFYNILYYLYKYRVKKPLPKWSFFESFYQQSKENKLGIIRLIKYDNKIIGGILSPVFPGKVIYEWYVCGLDLEYKHVYPSILATWAAIDYALKNNIRTFDFMGVGVPGKDYGVRDFKAKFGGEQVNYGRFGRINNKFLYAITEIGFNLLALLRRI